MSDRYKLERLEAGQIAYQRILQFQSNRWSISTFIFVSILIFLALLVIQKGEIWRSIFVLTMIASGCLQYQRQKQQNKRDLEFLTQLKMEYGEEVYAQIQKPPHSLYYYIFQKRYWPDTRKSTVALP